MRAVDNMDKERIICELYRLASYLSTTFALDAKRAGKEAKTPAAARIQGEAIGRREICAKICDDLDITFGITAWPVVRADAAQSEKGE